MQHFDSSVIQLLFKYSVSWLHLDCIPFPVFFVVATNPNKLKQKQNWHGLCFFPTRSHVAVKQWKVSNPLVVSLFVCSSSVGEIAGRTEQSCKYHHFDFVGERDKSNITVKCKCFLGVNECLLIVKSSWPTSDLKKHLQAKHSSTQLVAIHAEVENDTSVSALK